MKKEIKIFEADFALEMENKINDWLKQNQDITIIDIKTIVTVDSAHVLSGEYIYTIIYTY